MPRFNTDRWQLISPYLDQALEIPDAERAAWLDTLRRKEPGLAEELQTLLAEHGALDAEGFLEERVPRRPSLAGQTVGPYTLEAPLGRGGMGSVWSARRSDGRFEGKVAVKFLNFSLLGKEGEERFKREGSFLAKVAHPHIAHLIDAGVSDRGQPYLVLEYVEGEDIEAYCRTRELGTVQRIRLFLDVLAAVEHAHANLIVHRDIKPSNVMVTSRGQVKLLDFGIAKLLEGDSIEGGTGLTRDSEQAMTLAHAAPEQLTNAPITTGTDVYALGVLLYLLLSGKHPAERALRSQAELMESSVTRDPAPPSAVATDARVKRALAGDLDTLILKALKKQPAERYPSAAALAEDLQRFLHQQPISARPDHWAYRVGKFMRRNRTAVALSTVAGAAVVAGVTGTLLQARTARAERDFAVTQLARAEGINDLDDFVLSDAAPSGEVVSIKDLIARAENAVTHRQADDVMKAELLVAVGRLHQSRDDYARARAVLEKAYALASTLPEPSTRARAACSLAQALANESDPARADTLLEEGLRQLPDTPRYAIDRAVCLMRGAEIAHRAGHSHDAVSRAEAAQREVEHALYHSDVTETDNLVILATALEHDGQVDRANEAFQKALDKLNVLGRADSNRAATLYNNWGVSLSLWGNPLQAEQRFRRGMDLEESLSGKEGVKPQTLVNYARVLCDLDRAGEAAPIAERAYQKAKELGSSFVVNQSLAVRSAAYRKLGQLDRADQMLDEEETDIRGHLPPEHIAFAALSSSRSLNSQARGDLDQALTLANRAVEITEASLKRGHEGGGYLEQMLWRRADIELQRQQLDAAEKDARLVVSRLEGKTSVMLGRAYCVLGRALRAKGDAGPAASALRSAVQQLETTLGTDNSETRAARQLLD